jgi:M6 family metalloprotease-like protein
LLLVTAALVVAMCTGARGEPVAGEVFPAKQPDGSVIQVRVWGDEFYRVVESLDGYTLVRDPASGAACYARLSADGHELVSTRIPVGAALPAGAGVAPHIRISPASAKAKIAANRARAAGGEAEVRAATASRGAMLQQPACGGAVSGIVLLVDFSDEPWTIPPTNVDNYCNQVGYTGYGNNGSIRDYFSDVSDGSLTYTNFVPTAYYRAAHPKSYYEDPNISFGIRARELVLEALTDLDNTGFDFSQYDSNGDGYVDAVNCFYAGYRGSVWAEGLWPHSWVVNFFADGVQTYKYQITDLQNSLTLRTFCHENGHMLCYWPDLYDYDPPGPDDSAGVGKFCIMCAGTSSTNPQQPCAFMKYISGWATTTILTTPQTGLSVPSDFNAVYKYEHPSLANEYYLIENRQQTGRDTGLPDAGLAIWHVDEFGSNDWQDMTPERHYLVTLVQADGNWDLEHNVNVGDSTDLWAAPGYTECTPDSNPNTNWWDGSASNLFVTGISASGPAMTFNFNPDCNGNGVVDTRDIAQGQSRDCNVNGVPDECDIANCPQADPSCQDCNVNGIPDQCDIALGTSQDVNPANGVPDECDVSPPGNIVWDANDLSTDRTTRSLRFRVEGKPNGSLEDAIGVCMVNLQNPQPENAVCCPPQDFSAYEYGATCTDPGGCVRWVGKPGTFYEAQGPPLSGPYRAARLQCSPFYADWVAETAGGPITVVGAEIMPSSEYSVQTYGSSCVGNEDTCTNVSAAVPMYTRRSGDVETLYNPPGTGTQPDANDVTALVNKFKKLAGAPLNFRSQLQPNLPELNTDVSATDVVAVVDAFKGLAYPFGGPCPCPSLAICEATPCPGGAATCTGSGLPGLGAESMCVKTCSGSGAPCINDSHCPTGETCGNPSCRDKCGRCTP